MKLPEAVGKIIPNTGLGNDFITKREYSYSKIPYDLQREAVSREQRIEFIKRWRMTARCPDKETSCFRPSAAESASY